MKSNQTGGTMQRFKEILQNKELLSVRALSVYNPTEERLHNRAITYKNNPSTTIYAIHEDDLFKGITSVEKK